MSGIKVHSTFFLKYLNMAWQVCLFLFFIVLLQFTFIIFFPSDNRIVDFIIKTLSLVLMISLSLSAFKKTDTFIRKAWFLIIFWGVFIFLILSLNILQARHIIIFGNPFILSILLSLGNIGFIMAFILFSLSGESVFKLRRQLYIIGLTFISVLVISYIINYNSLTVINYYNAEPVIIRAAIIPIIISTFISGINLSTLIVAIEIFWISIRKKDEKRRVVFITIMISVFISYIINNYFLTEISPAHKTPVYVEISGTFAILLIGLAAWYEINIKEKFLDDRKYSLFFVSKIERIIPALSIIILMTVFYLNSHKLDELLIRTSILIFLPFIFFLLLYEWYSFRSEDALLSIMTISPAGILITDRKLQKIYFINDSLKKIFKSSDLPPDLILSHNTSDELKRIITKSITDEEILENVETVFIRPGGTAFNAQCKIVPAKYYSYDVVISWIADITERKKYENLILRQKYSAEIASLHKTELLNNLTNRIQSGYVTMKPVPYGWPDFILTIMNKRILDMFNYKEDLTGKTLRELFSDFEDRVMYRFFEVLHTGVALKRELNLKKIGKIFNALVFKISEDEIACLVDDVTENKKKEKDLEERERELRSLLTNFPGMAYRAKHNNGWPMLFVSQGVFDLCGYASGEILEGGQVSWEDITVPDDRDMVRQSIQEALDRKENFHIEYRIISKDGSVKQVWENGSGIYDDRGNFLFIEGFILDITKQKEAEAVLRESDLNEKEMEKAKALGQMAGGIAHDLNNRLMGMASFTSLIDLKVKDVNIKKYTDGIQDSIKKATELIDNLLIFARQIDINRNVISIHHMLHDVIERLADNLPEDIKINSMFNAANDSVKADLVQICRAVYDIVINARDAMPEGGTITINTENNKIEGGTLSDLTEGDSEKLFIVIKISDTGPGIEKENLGRIFDPFFTTKPVGRGRGLGLSAVYGTIQSHKGAITVDSRPGEGTTFSIYLPVA